MIDRRRLTLCVRCALIVASAGASAVALAVDEPKPDPYVVRAVPQSERERMHLAPFYTQYVDAGGFPIVGSSRVNPYALKEAAYLIDHELAARPDVRKAMIESGVHCTVMAVSEMTTDVPEHSDLTPKDYWDRRARGLGATPEAPCVSCGEENLLGLQGDPYSTENILIHEFGHAIHETGLLRADPTFDDRLRQAFEAAKSAGRWQKTYAITNRQEYWAEGTQSWFNCNRSNDAWHNDIDTREKLKAYDPPLAKLLEDVYGDGTWRYVRPTSRPSAEHLAGFDRSTAPSFRWPRPTTAATTRAAATTGT